MLDLLAYTGNMGVKPFSTPMTPTVHLVKEVTNSFQDPKRYKRLVGKLNYLIVTRSDFAYEVNVLTQFMYVPTVKQWATLEQIICYLKGAPSLVVLHKNNKHTHIDIVMQMFTGWIQNL